MHKLTIILEIPDSRVGEIERGLSIILNEMESIYDLQMNKEKID